MGFESSHLWLTSMQDRYGRRSDGIVRASIDISVMGLARVLWSVLRGCLRSRPLASGISRDWPCRYYNAGASGTSDN